jgi:hypothetical protein
MRKSAALDGKGILGIVTESIHSARRVVNHDGFSPLILAFGQ